MQAATAQTTNRQAQQAIVSAFPAVPLLVCLGVLLLSVQSAGQDPYDVASTMKQPPNVTVTALKP